MCRRSGKKTAEDDGEYDEGSFSVAGLQVVQRKGVGIGIEGRKIEWLLLQYYVARIEHVLDPLAQHSIVL